MANIQHIIEPIKKSFSINIFKSITGYFIVSSLLMKKIKQKIKIIKQIQIKLE